MNMKYKLAIGEKKFEVEVDEVSEGFARVTVNNEAYEVKVENYIEMISGGGIRRKIPAPAPIRAESAQPAVTVMPKVAAPVLTPATGGGAVTAPIPGLILDIMVNVGDTVSAGQVVATMEAMKMENNLMSNISGRVIEIRVRKGDQVATDDVIMMVG
jgi:glutaconyl-CoA/methylmalonyl-CoA decarboxylase subunit gamma